MLTRRIIIIGCGLTGPVLGMFLARRGLAVTIYDRGQDPRRILPRLGKSINITLAERGLHALGQLGLRERVERAAVPVTGRVIHHKDGRLESQSYGNFGEALWSIGRSDLNRLLIEAASDEPGLVMHFEQPCLELDLESRSAVFAAAGGGTPIRESAQTFIGADGAHSIVRQHLQERAHCHFSQRYVPYANKELHVPSDAGAAWMEHRHAIHIWPRGHHMLISFPNLDGSVTCSLHLPYEGDISYGAIKKDEQIRALFQTDFPDALPYIEDLEQSYSTHPYIPLLTVQGGPWFWEDRAVLIGDAAHAILPSYGQGANCGFEDCAVIADCLARHGDDRVAAFREFEARRRPNTDAIARLSEEHFYEIREHAADAEFQKRKRLELRLNRANPESFRSVYALISFSLTPYTEALQSQQMLSSIVNHLLVRSESEQDRLIEKLARHPDRYPELIAG